MPKRTLILMTLAVLLNLAAVPAMAKIDQGKTTQGVTAAKEKVTAADKARHLASARTQQSSGLKAWHYWHRKLLTYQKSTWYREKVMGRPRTRPSRRLASTGLASLTVYARQWQHTARRVLWAYRHPPHLSDWMCIHRYEGAWDDPGSPYWGGLQMDLSFQRTYGGWLLKRKGTADHWTPMEQIWVAVRAHRSRGFSPWPNTARDCGLY